MKKIANFFKRVLKYLKNFSKIVNESSVSTYSASASYYTILSFFPIVVLICCLLPYTPISSDSLFKFLDDFMPDFIVEIVKPIYNQIYSTRVAIISLTIILAIWTSGNGIFDIIKGLNSVNNVKEKRNWFVIRIMSSIAMLIFMITILFFLIFMVFGSKIKDILMIKVHSFAYVYAFLINFRFVFVWIITVVTLQVMYKIMPCKKMYFMAQYPGALFSSIMWSLFSWLLSMFVDKYAFESAYGNLFTIVFSFFWIYWLIYIVLIGAVINTMYEPHYLMKREMKIKYKKELKEKRLETENSELDIS